ncbi:glycosyltransferase family 2 protein [Clostridium sp. LIBA-8841]|uniref:glycosyltransferase family 2 protein n=1 Tax=Clostridium sp. LIBA-8841 TaxID=2987530 RepID=UPI002AC52004|nr:glycosyltransferase family 2 protein [Clostridium sp. LIBA-8841]MDZ5254379.1 glycosyltransferase [Clostridium sp. LIBA-8841]
MLPKVSVIVPIYKVENYLNRCVDSIINQTYENLEIILVDDGSPDKCGEIADCYERNDRRIKALHKKNGGLSDARNYGMDFVTGDYVLFVDSDDWLKAGMIEVLVKNSIELNADVVQSGFYYAYENYLLYDNRYYLEESKPIVLKREELMYELVVNERVKNFAWGKLYKTSLVKDISFKKGVLFEDVFWAHKVMDRVNKYVIIHKPMCYYMQREDSIVATYTERNLDILKGLKERHRFIEEKYSSLISESHKILFKTSVIHYQLLKKKKNIKNRENHMYGIKKYIRDDYKGIKKSLENETELMWQLKLFKINPTISEMYMLTNKVLRKLKLKKAEDGLMKIDL